MKFKPHLTIFFLYLFVSVNLANGQTKQTGAKSSAFRIVMDSGRRVYTVQCLACHQSDGLGVSNMNPPLTGKNIAGDKKRLITVVIAGLATHEEIDGKSYQNVMPPHPEMKDQDIASVLTYIRNSFGNKATSVNVSEVKTVRSRMK